MNPVLGVKVLPHYPADVAPPRYEHAGDSGFDLRAAISTPLVIRPGVISLVPTGLAFQIPEGYEVQVRPRSGLARHGLTVVNSPGTVDSGYTGEVKVLLTSIAEEAVTINPGDRIAQAVVAPVVVVKLEYVDSIAPTERGDAGFGSTGVK